MMPKNSMRLFILCGLIATAALADDGFIREYEWRAGDVIAARGVYVLRKSPRVHTSTLLYASAAGARFVLYSHSDAKTGVFSTRLTDDESGWWIEVGTRFGAHAETMSAFVKLMDPETGRPPANIAMFVQTRDHQNARAVTVPFADSAEKQWRTLASPLAKWKRDVPSEVAARLRSELPQLQRALGDVYSGLTYGFRAPVDVAMAAMDISQSGAVVATREKSGGRGFLLVASDQLALASTFRSISDPSEPLTSSSPIGPP